MNTAILLACLFAGVALGVNYNAMVQYELPNCTGTEIMVMIMKTADACETTEPVCMYGFYSVCQAAYPASLIPASLTNYVVNVMKDYTGITGPKDCGYAADSDVFTATLLGTRFDPQKNMFVKHVCTDATYEQWECADSEGTDCNETAASTQPLVGCSGMDTAYAESFCAGVHRPVAHASYNLYASGTCTGTPYLRMPAYYPVDAAMCAGMALELNGATGCKFGFKMECPTTIPAAPAADGWLLMSQYEDAQCQKEKLTELQIRTGCHEFTNNAIFVLPMADEDPIQGVEAVLAACGPLPGKTGNYILLRGDFDYDAQCSGNTTTLIPVVDQATGKPYEAVPAGVACMGGQSTSACYVPPPPSGDESSSTGSAAALAVGLLAFVPLLL